jgi:hypothetical protein
MSTEIEEYVPRHSEPQNPALRAWPQAAGISGFMRRHSLAAFSISAFLLIPCFWQRYIVAGDLDSHMYNAWLAQLIKQGRAPGLWIAPQWQNILFDVMLSKLGMLFGLAVAERIAVAACVLIFFWGGFALIAAATRRPPWSLVPCLAMLSYGWTFQMGFFNYYLSLGLSFFALSIFWRGSTKQRLTALLFVPAVWAAHPLGLIWLAGAAVYIGAAQCLSGRSQIFLLAATGIFLAIASHYVYFHFYVQWKPIPGINANGADQFSLFLAGRADPAWLWLIFGIICLSVDLFDRRRERQFWNQYSLPLQLYLAALMGVSLVPDAAYSPHFGTPISFITHPLSSICALLAICLLGIMRPRKWHMIGFSVIALIFFSYLHKTHVEMIRMETQAERLVSNLQPFQRVTLDLWRSSVLTVASNHIVDRACIGRCFSYSNYEPSSRQFRIRAVPGNPIVTSDPIVSNAMQTGEYMPHAGDPPFYQVYQCDTDPNRLCMRQLRVVTKSDGGPLTLSGTMVVPARHQGSLGTSYPPESLR